MEVYCQNIMGKEEMNKHIHNAILHLVKAVLCMMMLFLLFIMLFVAVEYSILLNGIVLFMGILTGMIYIELLMFILKVIKNETR